jgi:uncharacterized protein (TIGR02145 family)
MKNSPSKFALAVAFGLAITLIFNACSNGGGDSDGDISSSSAKINVKGSSSSVTGGTSSSVENVDSSSSVNIGDSSSSAESSSSVLAYNYCVFLEREFCLLGPMTSCPSSGVLSNSCPYNQELSSSGNGNSSSSNDAGYSSSIVVAPSSSSISIVVAPSSSSISIVVAPSSSSIVVAPSSSSIVVAPSSSSISIVVAPSSSSIVVAPSSSSSSIVVAPSSSSVDEYTGGSCDVADYGVVVVGWKWMDKNWGCYVPGSKCYNNNPDNCVKYGRLYDWATAMALPSSCNYTSCASKISEKHRGICPSGWHIPSNADWDRLYHHVDGTSGMDSPYDSYESLTAGKYLKAKEGWTDCGPSGSGKKFSCEDTFRFSALPGGSYSGGSFSGAGDYGYYWSASEYNSLDASYGHIRYSDDDAYNYSGSGKLTLFSVRCVQD